MSATTYCSFTLGEHLFGIDVAQVQEVLRQRKLTPVPLADRMVRGVLNLRGQVVTAIDLRYRLGLPSQPAQAVMNLVVRTRAGPVSLQVDEIHDVVEVSCAPWPAPTTIGRTIRDVVLGIHPLENGVLLILDLGRVLDAPAPGASLQPSHPPPGLETP